MKLFTHWKCWPAHHHGSTKIQISLMKQEGVLFKAASLSCMRHIRTKLGRLAINYVTFNSSALSTGEMTYCPKILGSGHSESIIDKFNFGNSIPMVGLNSFCHVTPPFATTNTASDHQCIKIPKEALKDLPNSTSWVWSGSEFLTGC